MLFCSTVRVHYSSFLFSEIFFILLIFVVDEVDEGDCTDKPLHFMLTLTVHQLSPAMLSRL